MMYLPDLLTIFAFAFIPACLGYFLDYCLGQPGSDNPHVDEIFSFYTLWLAKQAIGPAKVHELERAFWDQLTSSDPEVRLDGQQQLKHTIVLEGKKRFTWEKAAGMCQFCTNFWLALFASAIFFETIPLSGMLPMVWFILTPIFSHLLLRKF